MLESFKVKVIVDSGAPPDKLKTQLWTDAVHKLNADGNWHALDMQWTHTDPKGHHHFDVHFVVTGHGLFEFTVRVINESEGSNPKTVWGGGFGVNARLRVYLPDTSNPKLSWTIGPQAVEVAPKVYVGNFIASSQAAELGFDTVLNMANELDLQFPTNIVYKKLGCTDGANYPIEDKVIREAVLFIENRVKDGAQKILVHCRAGIGRSGSIGIAYLYYLNKSWNYNQTVTYIWTLKPDIYPHKNLNQTLEDLFPRKDG